VPLAPRCIQCQDAVDRHGRTHAAKPFPQGGGRVEEGRWTGTYWQPVVSLPPKQSHQCWCSGGPAEGADRRVVYQDLSPMVPSVLGPYLKPLSRLSLPARNDDHVDAVQARGRRFCSTSEPDQCHHRRSRVIFHIGASIGPARCDV
jgi:hypothetical protein